MGLVIIDRNKFPICVRRFKELVGISIYQCIRNNDPFEDHAAHAHCFNNDLHQGWICLKWEHILYEKFTLLHEVAHLIADKRIWKPSDTIFHGKKWREVVQAIGGTLDAYLSYELKMYPAITWTGLMPNDSKGLKK